MIIRIQHLDHGILILKRQPLNVSLIWLSQNNDSMTGLSNDKLVHLQDKVEKTLHGEQQAAACKCTMQAINNRLTKKVWTSASSGLKLSIKLRICCKASGSFLPATFSINVSRLGTNRKATWSMAIK